MLDISQLRAFNKKGHIHFTQHGVEKLEERCLKRGDVINCINTGEIIEQYENDVRLPSCLILGYGADGTPLHVCVGFDGDVIHIITAYCPDKNLWYDDLRTRRNKP